MTIHSLAYKNDSTHADKNSQICQLSTHSYMQHKYLKQTNFTQKWRNWDGEKLNLTVQIAKQWRPWARKTSKTSIRYDVTHLGLLLLSKETWMCYHCSLSSLTAINQKSKRHAVQLLPRHSAECKRRLVVSHSYLLWPKYDSTFNQDIDSSSRHNESPSNWKRCHQEAMQSMTARNVVSSPCRWFLLKRIVENERIFERRKNYFRSWHHPSCAPLRCLWAALSAY